MNQPDSLFSLFVEAVATINSIKYIDNKSKFLKKIKYFNIIRKAKKQSIKYINSIEVIDARIIKDFLQFIYTAKSADLFILEDEINLGDADVSSNGINEIYIKNLDNNDNMINNFSISVNGDDIKLTIETNPDMNLINHIYSIERERVNLYNVNEDNKLNKKIISFFIVNFAYVLSESIKIIYKNMKRMYIYEISV